jgi:hypothetical protein
MKGKKTLIVRLTIATMLVLSLAITQWPLPSKSAPVASLNLKSASQILSEAKTFDAAIQAINGISSLNLKDDSNLKTVESTLETHVPKLKLVRSKLIAVALNDSTLISDAKAKLSDQKAAEQFAIEVSKDVNAVLKLSGATAVRDRIQSNLQADLAKIQKTAQFIRDNEAARNAAARAELFATISAASMVVVAVIVVVIAIMVAVFTFGAAVGIVATAVAAGVAIVGVTAAVAAGAARLAAAATASAGAAAESAADKVAECAAKADSKYKSCKSDASGLWEPARTIAREGCKATWVYEAGKCLVTD